MAFVKFLPIIVGVILAGAIAGYAQATLPAPTVGCTTSLRVGYPDSLDESDVTDMYAYQLLKAQGICVTPTFYDAPPLSYKGLLSGQQDISFGTTAQSFAAGPGKTGQQTTCVTSYALAGVFLEIANSGITKPSQMLGKSADDFGPGTSTGSLDAYWYNQSSIRTVRDATGTVPSNVVNLKTSGGNQFRVADLMANRSQAIAVDDFILSDFTSPSINNSMHMGPFHVLFYAPTNYFDNCFAVTDTWLSSLPNQPILVKFITAIMQAQRYYITNPSALLSFAQGQLPLTASSEINYTSTFYPGHFTYWPYGAYNLIGSQNLTGKFANTNTFFLAVGSITTPVLNSSVTPFGVINKWFELQALQSLGSYTYPATNSWVTPSFKATVQGWVPSSFGTFG